ncbi:Uncharacterized protein OS=Actibacterium mucosum KCTC 23349 GN=ACMU_06805 PE=4 SV=1 [Gemmata massiliana]|uniref:Uncharacterized protein n=1 Tax=Gemmata massiliana TaxID=1210884 RepID=A0A6P2CY42_9BACT|nr:hypothetical protein [Gemmata massiliana]VTR93921.1 Uncharacterized protein OS=Actibacterium mucosum KCTC 23349 GN=ACMU_06805 PE=4 SV=1 [Gemmata massiliana]
MPRQNRVTPTGGLVAVPGRGTLMGNRGCLHSADGRVLRSWQLKRWIVCVLEFKGRKRQVMKPGHYTELFFLDEPTALAAGHRPCAECQRERFNAFRRALATDRGDENVLRSAVEIDEQLHSERLAPDRSKRTHTARLNDLPNGTFIRLPSPSESPLLAWGNALLSWSASGYTDRITRPSKVEVQVLTPELTVSAIRGGYAPELHPTALALLDPKA